MAMQVRRFSFSETLTDGDVDEVSAMLQMRNNVGYELHRITSHWGRDASWTDATDWTFRSLYGTEPTSETGLIETLANHTAGFRSREAGGVEWQPKRFTVDEPMYGIVVPALYVRRIAEGAAVAVNFNWGVIFQQVQFNRNEYLDLLRLWDIDLDRVFDAPLKYLVR